MHLFGFYEVYINSFYFVSEVEKDNGLLYIDVQMLSVS